MNEAQLKELAAQSAPWRRKSRRTPRETPLLRERAWWLIRQLGQFTIDDLLTTLVDGEEKNSYNALLKYTLALERVGVIHRLKRRAPGHSTLSRGHVIWRLARDLGRIPPVVRYQHSIVFDPNTQRTLATVWPVNGQEEEDQAVTQLNRSDRVREARLTLLDGIKSLQQHHGYSFQAALREVVAQAKAGTLDATLAAAAADCFVQARSKKGGKTGADSLDFPAERTLFRWMSGKGLTPKSPDKFPSVKPWMAAAVKLRRRMKTSTAQAVHASLCKGWADEWGKPISYAVFCRFLKGPYRQLTEAAAQAAYDGQPASRGRHSADGGAPEGAKRFNGVC